MNKKYTKFQRVTITYIFSERDAVSDFLHKNGYKHVYMGPWILKTTCKQKIRHDGEPMFKVVAEKPIKETNHESD